MAKKNRIKVTVTFLYDKIKRKWNSYYQNLAFDEIYNSDDVLQGDSFKVEHIELPVKCEICKRLVTYGEGIEIETDNLEEKTKMHKDCFDSMWSTYMKLD